MQQTGGGDKRGIEEVKGEEGGTATGAGGVGENQSSKKNKRKKKKR
jgi:hypothetical protein